MTPTDSRTQAAPAPLLDDVQTDRLAEVLRCPFEILPEVPSTNEELVERAQHAARSGKPLPDLSLLAAEHQSAGRGRLDRQWVTGPGEALTFSLLLRPARGSGSTAVALPTQSFPWLTVLLAAAIAQTLRGQGIAASLKWPNDVLVETGGGSRKICGVLASLVAHDGSAPALVLGAGLNVAAAPEGAASVRGEGSEASRGDLLVEILERFTCLYRLFAESPESLSGSGELRAEVQQLLSTLGRRVRAEMPGERAPLEGVAVGLDERGALLIDHDGGRTAVSAADVVHLRPIEEGDRS